MPTSGEVPEGVPREGSAVVDCVGAVVVDDGRLLVVRRAHAPSAGLWSVPGGKVEPGETDAQAVVREAAEETGLRVHVGRLLGQVDIEAAVPGVVLRVRDYACIPAGGSLTAGSDALEARWVTPGELRGLELVPGLLDALTTWGALPG
ncbi:NUDIX hydrolase [Motilibacter deserti]|uniref:NUDIX domain-containing protein n=1 Tax=Motilibacter deserti TaxID=2714956 RepID=A0ABX0GRX1_9ACTN|nr:NUDIX domain-containing protein [Motilibacter deserti]NHC13240.1 NUDIX domain-containing protein [Motilibacter deserti]